MTEVELVATRSMAEGLIFTIDGLSAPSEKMNYTPGLQQLSSRDEAIKAALHYPAGLNGARTFADVNAPFAADAYRYENGQVKAGPGTSSRCERRLRSSPLRRSFAGGPEMHVPGRRRPAVHYNEFLMTKTDQPNQQFHFQRSGSTSRVTVLNNLGYIMAEYDEITGVTRWTRVVPAAQRENVQRWLLKNYPVAIEVATPARRKKAA